MDKDQIVEVMAEVLGKRFPEAERIAEFETPNRVMFQTYNYVFTYDVYRQKLDMYTRYAEIDTLPGFSAANQIQETILLRIMDEERE